MRNKKKLKVFIIILLLVFLSLLTYLLFFKDSKEEERVPEAEEVEDNRALEDIEEEKNNKIYTFNEKLEEERDWDREDFKALAKSFAQLFGTYSSHSNFENLSLAQSYMSPEMSSWTDSRLKELRANFNLEEGFYSVSSEPLLDPEVLDFSPEKGRVEVLVDLERFELKEGEEEVFTQALRIVYTKNGKDWKVDGAYWE
jgi:hypothetical protein